MLGAIIGDIIGSPYEFGSDKTKDFLLFAPESRPTDDSIITIAVGCACAEAELWDENNFKQLLCEYIREIGLRYPDAGYGGRYPYQNKTSPDSAKFSNRSAASHPDVLLL